MAKKSIIARENKREQLVSKYAEKRSKLKNEVLMASTLDLEQRMQASMALQKLPRDSNRCRLRNRCAITGRPRGYYRRFGLSRGKLRELIMQGEAPGVTKASW